MPLENPFFFIKLACRLCWHTLTVIFMSLGKSNTNIWSKTSLSLHIDDGDFLKKMRKEILTAFKVASNSKVFRLQYIYLTIYSILHSVDVRDS